MIRHFFGAKTTQPRKLLKPELHKKPKGVTTQMKALDGGIHFVADRVHVFAIFMFNLDRETWQ